MAISRNPGGDDLLKMSHMEQMTPLWLSLKRLVDEDDDNDDDDRYDNNNNDNQI